MPLPISTYVQTKPIKRALSGKTVVKLYNQEGVRELLIPSNEPNYHPVLLTKDRLSELERQAAKRDFVDVVKVRETLAKESNHRREAFSKYDAKIAFKSHKLTELEQESEEKANYLLKRAWELRMEQEDEVKAANSLILKTKCQAIRDAQLAEKEAIRKKLHQEDRKIEHHMEEERLNKLLEEKRNSDLVKSKKDEYIKDLDQQVERCNQQRLVQSEQIYQERKHLNEATYLMMLDDVRKSKEAEKTKMQIRSELAMANEQIRKGHALEREEARLADLKVQEWMKQRAEREEAIDRELEEARRKRELETARLRAMQEKAGELHAQQQRMIAVRRQEEYEREWRKKEKEAAEKHRENEEKCLIMRQKQLKETRVVQAMEIAREKREFERNMKLQKESAERERLMEIKRRKESEEYREDLLRQMNEREAELISRRKAELAEGVAIRAEVAHREDEVKRVLRSKVSQMRIHKVPDMYISDVLRQLRLTEISK